MSALSFRVTSEAELQSMREKFLSAEPFQHVVIDHAFDPEVLRRVVAEFDQVRHNKCYGDNTTQRKHTCDDWARFPPNVFNLIAQLNAGPFLDLLTAMTGMEGLTSDPFLLGGGLHETLPGGFLKMHTDFNYHKRLKLDRRINAILFLNEGWQPHWGGELVLADRSLHKQVKVAPTFNRLVIFNTNDHSFHGQPDPHTFPEGNSRKSIAMYYYSNGRPEQEINSRKIGTTYKARHGGDLPLLERIREFGRTRLGVKRAR